MSRQPDGAVAREHMVATRFSDDELRHLDANRGDESRSEFIRRRTLSAPTRKKAT